MDLQKTASLLRIAAIVILVAGALTFLPGSGASKPILLHYKSKGSFSPLSTLILRVIGGALLIIRAQLIP
jgi:hypothetical protein